MSICIEPIALAKKLIRCQSVTPKDDGIMALLEEQLLSMGFTCQQHIFSEKNTDNVTNLYARIGKKAPNLAFAGHTDVVPPGDIEAWRTDPFTPTIIDGKLYGRGAVDMKCAIAAFISATQNFLNTKQHYGSISLIITGDEEGPAINGTKKLLRSLHEQGEHLDACIVGEPTSTTSVGDTVKIGRRGSITFTLVIYGKQGHVAYPQLAKNPIKSLIPLLHALTDHSLDQGNRYFDASNLEITTIDSNNPATNIIPNKISTTFNIRFNNEHTGQSLIQWVEKLCHHYLTSTNINYQLTHHISGEAFLSEKNILQKLAVDAIFETTGQHAKLSTSGGTSDARFLKEYCPVIEIGLTNTTAHKANEHANIQDIQALTMIYQKLLEKYFNSIQ